MKKIMFNDRYGLTQAVLDLIKTMTRLDEKLSDEIDNPVMGIDNQGCVYISFDTADGQQLDIYPRYQIGEVVAVAQPYKDVYPNADFEMVGNEFMTESAGWNNKMFVRSDLMPHRIRITNVKAERLQDISEEDAMREGIFRYDKPPLNHENDMFAPWPPYVRPYKHDIDNLKYRCTARYAFAYLIDKVNGKGTWERNPWVFAYEFELLKP